MKILIICSKNGGRFFQGESFVKTDGIFANERVIPNFKNILYREDELEKNQHNLIEKESLFLEKVVQIVKLPNTYDILIDDPLKYIVEDFKNHDLAIAIGIHEDILIELPRLISESGGKALIVPLESRAWLTKWVRDRTIEECKKYNIEYAFPKPFCALGRGDFNLINSFIDEFKIGRPKFRLFVDNDKTIVKAEVLITTPCGNLYNISKELEGRKLGEEAKETVAKYWHSFSCLGDVQIDPEVGDTIVHIGGHIHYSAIDDGEIIFIDK
jgi:thymidylate synthase